MYTDAWYVASWLFIAILNLSNLQVRNNNLSGPVYGHVPTMVGGMCCVLHCTLLLTIPAGVCLHSICKLIVSDDTDTYIRMYVIMRVLVISQADHWIVGADTNIPTLIILLKTFNELVINSLNYVIFSVYHF